MTPQSLQEMLCAEIGRITQGAAVQNERKEWCDLNVFSQLTPLKETEDDPDPFPYCTVGLAENQVAGTGEPQRQDVVLYFGIYYWDHDRQWQKGMLGIFEKIKERFLTDPVLGPFSCRPEMVCVLDDQDDISHPCYFGGMRLSFDLPNYERKDDWF